MQHHIRFSKNVSSLFLFLIIIVTPVIYAHPVIPQKMSSALWSSKNIGAGDRKEIGIHVSNGNIVKVSGSGRDIGGTHDQFYYVYSSLSGDGQLVAHMASQSAADDAVRAGLMLRETLADNAPNVFLALVSRHEMALQWREKPGGVTRHIADAPGKVPGWMKLVRQGNTITGWTSYDGSQWTKVQLVMVTMPTTVYIGFAVTAHSENRLSQAVFTHVRISRTPIASTPMPTSSPTPVPFPPVSQSATRVYGQANDFTANTVGVNANSLNIPEGVALDSSGNRYIADQENNRVLYYPASSTTATRVYGQSNLSNNAINAGTTGLNNPDEAIFDSSGNLYIADEGNNRVLYYPVGSTTATQVYGQRGSFSANIDNNGGVSANSLNTPDALALDKSNNLYIVDALNNRVLYYPVGSTTATRVYGQRGSFSVNVANNSGVSAGSLNTPNGVALDSSGNLYVVDTGNNRVLYYPAGSTTATQVYGQDGSFATNQAHVSANGLKGPNGVIVDASNNVYIADTGNNRVLYYPAGSTTATQVYGQDGSFITNASTVSAKSLNTPFGIAVDRGANVYIADAGNSRVLYYPAGSTTATQVYGQGGNFFISTNNDAINADTLNVPNGVAVDSGGNLYIADSGNNRVLYYPAGKTKATRVYGQGGDFTTNGANVSATGLNIPVGIALDSKGNVYIADANNSRVLYYPAGKTTATRVYGQGGSFSTNTDDKGGISAASLVHPFGVALDKGDNLYITDTEDARILYYPTGRTTATQVYGQAGSFTTNVANKGGINAMSLFAPLSIAIDSSGNLYTADTGDNRAFMFSHS